MSEPPRTGKTNRYSTIIERIFLSRYQAGDRVVPFEREEIEKAAADLNIALPKNIGDLVYSFRYRTDLPQSIKDLVPKGEHWLIWPAGRSRYKFVASPVSTIIPNPLLAETKVPDSTPGVIAKYALSDEQALLAKLRYNRLVDVFTGVTCYSLQNHLRTSVMDMGQVETDEIYIGLDKRGAHYVFPVQAKGGKDIISIVQIGQDSAMCAEKFPALICHPLAAQFIGPDLIALFLFDGSADGVSLLEERHYRLVPEREVTADDLESYRSRTNNIPSI